MVISNCVEAKITEIPLSELVPDENQPRKYIDQDRLEELIKSIRENGIVTPLLYREENGKKILVSGEYRYKAATELKYAVVPAQLVLRDYEFVAVTENLLRNSLTPMEQAVAVKSLIKGELQQVDVARKLGRAESNVSEIIKPSELPQDIQDEALKNAFWSRNKLLQLVRAKDEARRNALFEKMKLDVARRIKARQKRQEKTPDAKPETAQGKEKISPKARIISGINSKAKSFSEKLKKELAQKWDARDKKQVRKELKALAEAIHEFLGDKNSESVDTVNTDSNM
jgi:ParB family chromosome partitioning protein